MDQKNERSLKDRLHISTTADDAEQMARAYGVSLEVADYCTAANMDQFFDKYDPVVRKSIAGMENVVFHAPFNELSTAAIEPLVTEVTFRRYNQAFALARQYGITKMVYHSSFIPSVYFPEWFIPRSIEFWKEFLKDKPDDAEFCIENVMENQPGIVLALVKGINDPRVKMCLDIGHANLFGETMKLRDWIKQTAPVLGHVHIHNNYGNLDIHNTLGDGIIPMEEVLLQLTEAAPEATFTVENIHSESSMIWLKEHSFL